MTPDEERLIAKYRQAKAMKWADINISIEAGSIAKLWVTEKTDVNLLKGAARLKEAQP